MKKQILIVLMVMLSAAAKAQLTNWVPYKSKNVHIGLAADSLMYMPVKDTNHTPQRIGALTMRPQDSSVYIGISKVAARKWVKVSTTSSGVDSIWRIPGNDSIFYVKNGVTYAFKDSTGGGTTSLSSITAATATNTINNSTYAQNWQWNGMGNNIGLNLESNSISSGILLNLNVTGTAAFNNLKRGLQVNVSGANANASQTSFAARFSNASTGTGAINVAVEAIASAGQPAIRIPNNSGSLVIGSNTPNASALLDVTGTTAGVLIPRMNTAQQNAISTPATGLLIYNTDSATVVQYNGSAWMKLSGGSGTPTLQQVTGAGNTTTDTVELAGVDPTLSLKQATSNQQYKIRVGVGTGISSQSFNIYNQTANKHLITGNDNRVIIGNPTNPFSGSTVYIKGYGSNGSNLDVQPDSTIQDEGNIEIMASDYAGGKGIAMRQWGNVGTASYVMGYLKKNMGVLDFTNDFNLIRTNSNRSLRFGLNNIERVVFDSNGRVGIGITAPTAWLNVQDADGTVATALFDAHEDRAGEIVSIKQAGGRKFSFNTNGSIDLAETSLPSNPDSNVLRIVANNSNSKLYTINDVGKTAQLIQDISLKFGAGSNADADTAAFTTTAYYGDYFTTDSIKVVSVRAVMKGTSPSMTYKIFYNDSLGVEAGATALVTAGTAITNTTTGTNTTSFDVATIPPNVYVWVVTSTVGTKPKYFSVQLNGYLK